MADHEKQTRAAEATLFEAAHQLKEALRAANQSEELRRVLDAVQKRFLLLGEVGGFFFFFILAIKGGVSVVFIVRGYRVV